MTQWTNARVNQWVKMNQWIDDWVKRWVNDSVIQCNEPKKHWWSESTNRWMILCWATSSLSDLFAEAPLLSTTYSLGSHLSGLPLLWPTSQLAHCSFCNSILLFAQLFHYFLAKLFNHVDAETVFFTGRMLISFRYFTQCFPPSPCRFQKQTGVRLQEPHTFYWVRFQQVIWILSRKTLQFKQKSIWNIENDNCLEKTYTFRKTSRHVESDPVHDDVACILSPTDCSASALLPYRQNSVHFFNIPTSSRGPRPPVFNTFYFGMCFAPQGRAFFTIPTSKNGRRPSTLLTSKCA